MNGNPVVLLLHQQQHSNLLLFLLWGEQETLVLLYSIGYSIYIGRRSMKSEFRHVDKVIRSFSHPEKGKGIVCTTDRKCIWYTPKNKHSTWQEAFQKGNSSSNPSVSGAMLVSGWVYFPVCGSFQW